jgi:precorrin-4/cobalt-precorrin-4 C11-methyltransferase
MNKDQCRVFFIGAGPGDPELLTIKGQRFIREADLVLYAGSLVPEEIVAFARKDAKVADSSTMTLEETHAMIVETVRAGGTVARVHTGDPALYGAVREQMALLDRDGIDYEMIPGVTAAFAAASAAKVSFTLPEKTQSLVITRLAGRTPVPDRERLRAWARHGSSMAVYLSASNPETLVAELLEGGYSEDTPVVIGHRVGWPDQTILSCPLSKLVETVQRGGIKRQAVFLVLPGQRDEPAFSKLYSPAFTHGYRKGNH